MSRRLICLLSLALLGATPATASAAFPGNNGKVAFSRETTAGNTEIFTVGREGGAVTRLTTIGSADDEPAWSPDGSRIAFTSDRGGSRDIWVMNANGSGVIQLTSDPAEDHDPAWSPDGTRIAFASDRDGDGDIYAMNSDGSGVVNVSNTPLTTIGGDVLTAPDGSTVTLPVIKFGHETEPAWSPTGRIAFASDRTRNTEVFVMNADGSGQGNVTNSTGQDSAPSWAPDGSRFAYEIAGFPADGVGLRSATGGGFASLAEPAGWDESPAFSPDGRRIAFRGRARSAGPGVYTMRTDKALLTRITTGASDADPDWQPCAACAPQLDPPPPPTPGTGGGGGSGSDDTSGPRGDAPVWAPEAPGGGIIQLSGTSVQALSNSGSGASARQAPQALTIGARVIRVTGGDTVRVELFNASRRFVNLRLLGIDARGFGSRSCGRANARAALKALLLDARGRGRTLILKTDPAIGTFDSLARLQAYASLRTTGKGVQNTMLAGGWARATAGKHVLRARYRRLEQGARSARRGLWRRCVSR